MVNIPFFNQSSTASCVHTLFPLYGRKHLILQLKGSFFPFESHLKWPPQSFCLIPCCRDAGSRLQGFMAEQQKNLTSLCSLIPPWTNCSVAWPLALWASGLMAVEGGWSCLCLWRWGLCPLPTAASGLRHRSPIQPLSASKWMNHCTQGETIISSHFSQIYLFHLFPVPSWVS